MLKLEAGDFDSPSRRTVPGSSRKSALVYPLHVGGLVLIGTFINSLIFSSFPLQLMLPEWQLRVAGTLLSTGVTAFIGTLLIQLSLERLKPQTAMAARGRLIRQLAGWAAIGYIALIPAQIYAGIRLNNQRAEAEKQPRILWGKLRARILAAETESDLRNLLGNLPQPPSLPAKLEVPLPAFKQEVIQSVDARFASYDNETKKSSSERIQTFIYESIRNSIQSLLLAAGFAAVAKKFLFGRRGEIDEQSDPGNMLGF